MTEPSDVPSLPYKVVVLGDSSIGKTSLVNRFTADKYISNTANTIGAAFITKEYTGRSGQKVKYEIWDTAGQERYRSLTPMYYRNSRIALVCFDMGNIQETLSTAKYWIDQLALNGGIDSDTPIKIKLVGNKSDLFESVDEQQKQAELESVESFCRDHNLGKWYKTSSKEGSGVKEVFDDIVDEIDPQTFTEYHQRSDRVERTPIENILNSRQPNNNCC